MWARKAGLWVGATGLALAAVLAGRLGIGALPNAWGALDDTALALLLMGFVLATALLPRAAGTALAGVAVFATIAIGVLNSWFFRFYRGFVTLRTAHLLVDLGESQRSAMEFASSLDLSLVVGLFLLSLGLFHAGSRPRRSVRGLAAGLSLALGGALTAAHAAQPSRFFSVLAENPILYLGRQSATTAMRRLRTQRLERRAAAARATLLPSWPGRRYPFERYPLYSEPEAPRRPTEPRNVIVVVLESVRAADMGLYGAARSVTPNLDRIARENFWARRFYASASQTVRAELAIMCSQMDFAEGASLAVTDAPLPFDCLPKILGREGYATYWFHGYRLSFFNRKELLPKMGYEQIFGAPEFRFATDDQRAGWGVKDEVMLEHALRRLEGERRPFFAELLLLTNHHPFDHAYGIEFPPHLQRTTFLFHRWQRGMYYSDHAIGRFYDTLLRSPLRENTLVIFVGDHSLYSYDPETEADLTVFEQNEQFFRVPFVALGPGVPKGSLAAPLSQVDIAPTLLEWLGFAIPGTFVGVPFSATASAARPRVIYNHTEGGLSYRHGDVTCVSADKTCFPDRFPRCGPGEAPSWGRVCAQTTKDLLLTRPDDTNTTRVRAPLEAEVESLLEYQQNALDRQRLLPPAATSAAATADPTGVHAAQIPSHAGSAER